MAVQDYNKSKDKRNHRKQQRKRDKRRIEKHFREDTNVLKQYQKKASPLDLGELEFRLTRLRKQSKNNSKASLKAYTESIDWIVGDGVVSSATIGLRIPAPHHKHPDASILDGDKLKLECKWGRKWREVWRMRVWAPSISISQGTLTVTCYDDLKNLENSQASFTYTKDKKGRHKDGWRADEIVADVAHRFKLRVGTLVKTQRQITDLTMHKSSGLDVITKAYKLEQEDSGKQYVMHFKNGKLSVTNMRRQPLLYVMREQIMEAIIGHERDEKFFTALTLTGNQDKSTLNDQDGGNSDKVGKLEVTVSDHRAVKKYGWIEHEDTVDHNVKDKSALKHLAKRKIAKQLLKSSVDDVEVTHPGIPFIRKGDAIQVKLPEYGLNNKKRDKSLGSGNWSVLFVKTISHTISGGTYTMDVTMGTEDPWALEQKDIREQRDEDRRQKLRDDRDNGNDGNSNDGGTSQ